MSGVAYECDGCGLCCQSLLVEAGALDVVREPRIEDVAPLRGKKLALPLLDATWLLAGHQTCPFLQEDRRCGVYATRPNVCVAFLAGSPKCQSLRADAGLPALVAVPVADSIVAELCAQATARDAEDE